MKKTQIKTMQEYLSYYANEGTRAVRKSGLLTFLEFVCKTNRTEDMEEHLKKYMSKKRDHYNDLLTFAVHMSSNNVPPMTARSYISSVREYFLRCGIEFTELQLRDIRNKSPKGSTRTEEDDLTKDIIKQILQYTDVRGRALFLTLISSGMRIGEALQLNINDLNDYTITIRGDTTKTGEHRYSFIHKEAKTAIEAYLKVRDRYLETAFARGGRVVEKKDEYKDKLFPFSDMVALQIFSNALQKAGLEKFSSTIHRRSYHIHMLRKYFRSQLAVGCPPDIVEALMGHNGYLSSAYRRYTKTQMYEHYNKAEHLLYINEVDLNKIESKYEQKLEVSKSDQQQQIDQLKSMVGALAERLGINISLPTGEPIQNIKVVKTTPDELVKRGLIESS